MIFTKYRIGSGEIIGVGECIASDIALQVDDSHEVLAGHEVDGDAFYILDGKPKRRPAVVRKLEREISADGKDVVRVENVPPGTMATVAGEVYQVDDGTLAFSTAKSGNYRIDLRPPFPFQHQLLKVTAK